MSFSESRSTSSLTGLPFESIMKYSCNGWGSGRGPSSEWGALFSISMTELLMMSSSMAFPARSPCFNGAINASRINTSHGWYCYLGDTVPLHAVIVLGAIITAPRAVGIERIQVRKVVEVQTWCVKNVKVLAFAENGARLPWSIF